MLVKDHKGNLIERSKARKIKGENGKDEFYLMGVDCIKMPDGKWYRTTTGKIIFDYSKNEWVHYNEFKGSNGLVAEDKMGHYSNTDKEVTVFMKKEVVAKSGKFNVASGTLQVAEGPVKNWNQVKCISEEVAKSLGFEESIFDSRFYKKSDCNSEELKRMTTPNIPNNERNNVYSLDDDKDTRIHLEKCYDDNNIKVENNLKIIANKYIPFTSGIEIETQNGHCPERVRNPLGFRVCRDGSLDGGLEFVSVPMLGGKALQAEKYMCSELTKRCVISNKCSVHYHFGDVRRDKLYVVSLWTLLFKIQDELRTYFPYSRTNSIREDGKIYAALLPDLKLETHKLLNIKNETDFKSKIVLEFNKIYSYLNNGHPPGEEYDEQFVKESREIIINGKAQKQYCYRLKKFTYTTKLPRHAIQGQKWQKTTRYHWVNLLNLFFAHSRTVEFRIAEASTNFDKILLYKLLCVAILKYAEHFKEVLSKDKVSIKDILYSTYSEHIAHQVYEYFQERKLVFCNERGNFRENWKSIEQAWINQDKTYKRPLNVRTEEIFRS